jgi:hypothetical protein
MRKSSRIMHFGSCKANRITAYIFNHDCRCAFEQRCFLKIVLETLCPSTLWNLFRTLMVSEEARGFTGLTKHVRALIQLLCKRPYVIGFVNWGMSHGQSACKYPRHDAYRNERPCPSDYLSTQYTQPTTTRWHQKEASAVSPYWFSISGMYPALHT